LWYNFDLSIPVTISGKHIKLTADGGTRQVARGASGFGSLFDVQSGASLTLEGKGNNQLIIDGGKTSSKTATAALVTVRGTLTLNAGAIIRNNSNNNDGGGVYVNSGGSFNMNGGAISGNASIGGGGVYLNSGTFNMSGGDISGNTAEFSSGSNGGGVYLNSGTFNMSGGDISKNRTKYRGGGIYVNTDSTFNMTGGILYGYYDLGTNNKNISGNLGSALYNNAGGRVIIFGTPEAYSARLAGLETTQKK
jgi:hypothetical protein